MDCCRNAARMAGPPVPEREGQRLLNLSGPVHIELVKDRGDTSEGRGFVVLS